MSIRHFRIIFVLILLNLLVLDCLPSFCSNNKNLRLISLAPSVTEILFALDLKNNIVGVSNHCNYPREVSSIAKVGSFSRPNIEKILSLKPDIVFLTALEQGTFKEKLERVGLKAVTIYPQNIDELFLSIETIGKLTYAEPQAKALISKMKREIAKIKNFTKDIPIDMRKKVFIEIWDDPLMTAGPNSFVGELITMAGGINIAYDVSRDYSKFSPELVIERNPNSIILAYMFLDKNVLKRVYARLGWNSIDAIKTGNVFNDINPDLILRPGPRLVKGLEEIYDRLYGNQ